MDQWTERRMLRVRYLAHHSLIVDHPSLRSLNQSHTLSIESPLVARYGNPPTTSKDRRAHRSPNARRNEAHTPSFTECPTSPPRSSRAATTMPRTQRRTEPQELVLYIEKGPWHDKLLGTSKVWAPGGAKPLIVTIGGPQVLVSIGECVRPRKLWSCGRKGFSR